MHYRSKRDCIGVYIFGDLRQLRKFELSRPAISRPKPLMVPSTRPTISHPIPGVTPILPAVQPRLAIVPSPPAHVLSARSPSRASALSSAGSSFESHSSYSGETGAIHISPAYYDDSEVQGPATSPTAPDHTTTFTFPTKREFDETQSGTDSFAATASFIHPFDQILEEDRQLSPRTCPEDRHTLSAFDFDALPRCSYAAPPQHRARRLEQPRDAVKVVPEALPLPKSRLSPMAFIERMQAKCVTQWSARNTPPPPRDLNFRAEGAQPGEKMPHRPRDTLDASFLPHLDLRQPTRTRADRSVVRKQFKLVNAVPAFAVPLTPVLSSIVVRGQWEIVTRSAFIALFLCWVILGSLLAIPPLRR
jgi:hypothetical protein